MANNNETLAKIESVQRAASNVTEYTYDDRDVILYSRYYLDRDKLQSLT